MRHVILDIATIDRIGWTQNPSNTVYQDGHREGTVTSRIGHYQYSYTENAQCITVYIPEGEYSDNKVGG